jgi:hypothetical protein
MWIRCVCCPLSASHSCLQARPDNNSVVAFKDNSSAIRGFKVKPLLPLNPGGPSALAPQARDWDLLLTAETHNFPCAVAPYPGGSDTVVGFSRFLVASLIGCCKDHVWVLGCLSPSFTSFTPQQTLLWDF